MEEKEYRLLAKQAYQRVEDAFEEIDPDLAEVEPGQGTLCILSAKSKTILSSQPSVRQLWLAVAAKGVALHFNWDADKKIWVDDKVGDKELFSFLEATVRSLVPELSDLKI